MKQIRIIGSIFTLVALLLCSWSIYQLSIDGVEIVGEILNFLYFASLFISLLCFRISLNYSEKINLFITALSIGVIGSSTYTWLYPSELLVVGKITLGLIPLLLGKTLLLFVKIESSISKLLFLVIAFTAGILSICVFVGVSASSVYTIALVCLSITTLFLIAYLIFARTN